MPDNFHPDTPKHAEIYEDGDIRVIIRSHDRNDAQKRNITKRFIVQWNGNNLEGQKWIQPFEKARQFAEAKFDELKEQREREGSYIKPIADQPKDVRETFDRWVGVVPDEVKGVPINKWGKIARAKLLGYAMLEVIGLQDECGTVDIKKMKALVDIIEILDPEGCPKGKTTGSGGSSVNIAFLSSGELPPLKVIER